MTETVVRKIRADTRYLPASWYKTFTAADFERAVADAIAEDRASILMPDNDGKFHTFNLKDTRIDVPYGGQSIGFMEVQVVGLYTVTRSTVSLTPLMGW